jgi:hypothetical protein
MRRLVIFFSVACLLAPVATAGAQTLEEQLRTQLRDARGQLQDLQIEQAQWQAQKASLEQARDQARKTLESALASAGGSHAQSVQDAVELAREHTARMEAEASSQQQQKSLVERDTQVKAENARNTDLTSQLAAAQAQVGTCTSKNLALYKVGGEILDAYSHMSVGTMLSSRQPFAASARVRLENAAQGYGDRLYDQRYDPRAIRVAPAKSKP